MNTTNKKIRAALSLLMPLFALFAIVAYSCGNDAPDCCDNIGNGDIIKPPYDYFAAISKIPRCSGNEQAVSDYLIAFGDSLGFETYQDDALNVLIRKPGSAGREHEPYIILQAHMDMVCAKDHDVDHDFDVDPIIPVINDDGWVTASKRTTLGADNGSGVSIIMAVLASTFSHPPIEALLTADEERGLTGADKFDAALLRGKRLVNLDLTDESIIVSSSTRESGGAIFIPMISEPSALAKAQRFPDWDYRENSPLRNTMAEVFKIHYGRAPIFAAINVNYAAIECVIFAHKLPDLDQAAVGANMENIHTPSERMDLASYERLYGYIIKLLGAL